MPVNTGYPGVYVQDLPAGAQAIAGVSTSIAAFVGRTPMGPVETPVGVNSWGDYVRAFGGIDAASPVSWQVKAFFENGGNQAVVVRLFHAPGDGSGAAEIALGLPGEPPALMLRAGPGSWGNRLAASIDRNGITEETAHALGVADADALFNLAVTDSVTEATVMSLRNVTLDPAYPALLVANVLAALGGPLHVASAATALPAAPLTGTASGGADSAALGIDDYIGDPVGRRGVFALDALAPNLFNILCIPPDADGGDTPVEVYRAAADYCAAQDAMLILDPPAAWQQALDAGRTGTIDLACYDGFSEWGARSAAVYFPRVTVADPLDGYRPRVLPACGTVAGIYAHTDMTVGVWRAPAGTNAGLAGVTGLTAQLTDSDSALLNPLGINCLRSFPVFGTVVWGARTLRGADALEDAYKYVNVRRLADYVELSLKRGLQWAMFEPNGEQLWSAIRASAGAFMGDLFRQGAFFGDTAASAWFLQCDSTTTTAADIESGIVNVIIGFAPVKPAEFVVLHIQLSAGAPD